MTDTIDSLPDYVTDAGLEFHYNVWTPDTVLTLANVPWNSDYRDLVRFPDQSYLDTYLDSSPNLIISDLSYLPFNRTVMIDTPINAAMRYNYVRARNSLSPVPGEQQRSYYYFIVATDYVASQTTQLTLQLDVWQTFGYEVTFGQAYLERGHLAMANTNSFNHFGRDYLTIPEGLDTGSDYRTVNISSQKIMDNPDDGDSYSILIVSTVDITQSTDSYGNDDEPKVIAARGSTFQGLPSGADLYIFKKADDFKDWILAMQSYPWVVQGIVSITLIPSVSRYFGGVDSSLQNVAPAGMPDFYQPWQGQPGRVDTQMATDWREAPFIGNVLGPRYAHLKKFLTSPYMVIELTTWTGSPVILRPEMWQDGDATLSELAAFFPPGQRIAIFPRRYNYDPETDLTSPNADPSTTQNDDGGEFLDMAAILDNFPSVPIVSNNAGLWLAQNRHSVAFQFNQANWSQQRAVAGAQAGADVANAGIRNMGQQAGIYNQQQAGQTAIDTQAAISHGVLNAGGGLITGVGSGNVVGGVSNAALSALGTATNVMQMSASSSLGQATRNSSAGANIAAAGSIRDTNQQYANFAAQGDYAMAQAGINARVQDSQMAQPSAQGQFGGDAFNLINHYVGFSLRWKMLNLQTLRAIGDFWLRYGYAVRQYVNVPADFMCMTKFTYWKLQETYISQAPMPENFKQTIRGIFEKGVTVWRNPADIGNTDWADNAPVAGVTF